MAKRLAHSCGFGAVNKLRLERHVYGNKTRMIFELP
jgi:hypothetical protein